jgi:IS30 family transposase
MSYSDKPYSSWEIGQNTPIKVILKIKNANGLLRQYFSKKRHHSRIRTTLESKWQPTSSTQGLENI